MDVEDVHLHPLTANRRSAHPSNPCALAADDSMIRMLVGDNRDPVVFVDPSSLRRDV